MFFNPSHILFFSTLLMGSFMTISANSWLGAWMGLEINLLSFIPLMIDTKNSMSTEAALKYFITQALASSVLLFSILIYFSQTHFSNFMFNSYSSVNILINSCLLLKMGAAPFHFWFPNVMEGLTWMKSLILLTIQKLAPLILLSYSLQPTLIFIIVIMSVIIGATGGLNQTSLRKIMAFSSINHVGWILSGMLISETAWMTYFLMYSFLTMMIIQLLNMFQLFYFSQLFSFMNNSPLIKFSLFTSLLSLGGLPPFLGFFPKWLLMQQMIENNMITLMIIMVTVTLIALFFYIRLFYSSVLFNFSELSWNFKNLNNKIINKLMINNFVTLSGLFFMTFIYACI
uniref:NADH-ubiquinone oxidoreductase chain 2 n=1 Tax=Neocurupira hudsoni TaxID=547872 RepID=V9I0Q7_9DIPT|nr:NADH dehydrogenase subunit 2 [Neocurupira hudsoni]